jgi:hypothetical protein
MGVTIYVAFPLLKHWAGTARRVVVVAWAAYRLRASWRL